VSRLLTEAGGLQICDGAEALAEQVVALMKNPQQARQMGQRAHQVAEANRGALEKLLTVIDRNLSTPEY